MADIQLRNISKRWGDFVGVANFDLDIPDREFLVLLGPSGCGKTTTMRMIAGLEDPTEGEILIGGKVVNDLEPKDRDVAMVFQSYALYPNMDVYENIRFPLKVRGIDAATHDEKVRRASAMVELDDFLHRKPAALSGGQRQRVALARAIVREPNVFLMDEPLSNLDAKLRVSTRAQIKNLSHELAVTTIYVTHDQIEAMTLADRVVVMEKGIVQQVGSPTEIYDRPANTFVASFIGNPAMNLIEGTMQGGTFTAPGTEIGGLDAPDGPVTLGFRAEDASVGPKRRPDHRTDLHDGAFRRRDHGQHPDRRATCQLQGRQDLSRGNRRHHFDPHTSRDLPPLRRKDGAKKSGAKAPARTVRASKTHLISQGEKLMYLKTVALAGAMTLTGSVAFACEIGARVSIVGNEFPAIQTVGAGAQECAGGEVTTNLTADHQKINLPGMQGNPAEYTSAIIANSSIVALMNEDVIRPLDDLVAKHGGDLKPNQLITIDGKVMAVAFMANAQHLVYRKDILDQIGMDAPKPMKRCWMWPR